MNKVSKISIKVIVGSSIFIILSILSLIFNIGGDRYHFALADLNSSLAALFAFFASLYVLAILRRTEDSWSAWLFMSIGLGLYTLAEISWSVYEIVLDIKEPYPSWADALWLLGYLPLFIAMIIKLVNHDIKIELKDKLKVFATLAAALAVTSVYILIPIATYQDISNLEKVLDMAYPILDFLIIAVTMALVIPYGRGRLGLPWMMISVGFLIFGVADICFSYLTWNEIFETGGALDLLWILGYVMIGIGAILESEVISNLLHGDDRELLREAESAIKGQSKTLDHHLV